MTYLKLLHCLRYSVHHCVDIYLPRLVYSVVSHDLLPDNDLGLISKILLFWFQIHCLCLLDFCIMKGHWKYLVYDFFFDQIFSRIVLLIVQSFFLSLLMYISLCCVRLWNIMVIVSHDESNPFIGTFQKTSDIYNMIDIDLLGEDITYK